MDRSAFKADALRAARRGVPGLAVSILLTYVLALASVIVAANLARGVGAVLLDLADGRVWSGVLTYVVGLGLTAVSLALPLCALLAATVVITRSALDGERSAPWRPFVVGLQHTPALLAGLAVIVPRALLVLLVAIALVVLSVITVPAAVLTGIVWLTRPAWRRPWMRWPLLVGVPLAIFVHAIVRWALWLPYVVLDRTGPLTGLSSSRAAVADRWRRTAAPLAGLTAVVLALAVAWMTLAPRLGASATVVGLGLVAALLVLLIGGAIVVTVLHRHYAVPALNDPRAERLGRRTRMPRRPWMRPRPGIATVLVIGLLAQALVVIQAPASAGAAVHLVVDSLADDPSDCLTTCTLRGAIEVLNAAAWDPASMITFDVTGTIELADTLEVRAPVTIDGLGERVRLQRVGSGSVVWVQLLAGGGEGGGEGGENPPEEEMSGPVVLRNLTIANGSGAMGGGLFNSNAPMLVDRVTFTGNRADEAGSAILNGGTMTIVNSTFHDNVVPVTTAFGGAVYGSGTTTVVNSTFVGNTGGGVGGFPWSVIDVRNSVFLGGEGGFNCAGTASGGNNLSNDGSCPGTQNIPNSTMGLPGPLADNGGSVDTFALLPGSPAIGAGNPDDCPTHDARGVARPSPCDAGAYQSETGTTTTVTSNVTPARFGATPTITVTVTHPSGVRPTGSVSVARDTDTTDTPTVIDLTNGVATLTLPVLAVGDHLLTATYVPDDASPFDASEGSLTQTIWQQLSAVVLEVAPTGSSDVDEEVTLTATVRNAGDVSGPVPTGSVTFLDGTTELGTGSLTDGVATLVTDSLAGGSHSMSATYEGSDDFSGSTSAAVAHLVQSSTTVTLSVPATSVYGDLFTLGATVTGSTPTPTGHVMFSTTSHVGVAFGSLVDGAITTAITTPLPVGTHEITAAYAGDDFHEPAVSDPTEHEVTTAVTTTSLAGPDAHTTSGEPATFTATVTPTGTPAVPTGAVEFKVDGDVRATVTLDAGVAEWAPTDLGATAGGSPHDVVATYLPGHNGFATSTSTPVSHAVAAALTTTQLAVSPNSSVTGEAVTLTATLLAVAPGGGHPTGTVEFRAGGAAVASAVLIDGVAETNVTTLPVAAHDLTAHYAGDGNYVASATLASVSHTVTRAATTTVLTASPGGPATFGDQAALTATVTATAPGGGVPSGVVVFASGEDHLGQVALDSAGVAELVLPTGLAAGSHDLTATFAQTAGYQGSTGPLAYTVLVATATIAVTGANPSPSVWGQPVAFTATVVGSTATPPTGEVEFFAGGSLGKANIVDGVATLSVLLTLGPHANYAVEATYLGDDNHALAYTPRASDADIFRHTVNRAPYTITVTSAPSPSTFGQDVTITADMGGPIGGRIPSGIVQICGGFQGCTGATFDADGRATRQYTPTQTGPLTFRVDVEGDPWFEPVTSEEHTHTVGAGTATLSLAVSPQVPVVGSPATLVATVGPTAAFGSGQVSFWSGEALLGYGFVDAFGRATLITGFASRGTRTVTATYETFGMSFGDASAALDVTVSGKPLAWNAGSHASLYGDESIAVAYVGTSDVRTPHPGGTVTLTLDGRQISTAALFTELVGGSMIGTIRLPISDLPEPGRYTLELAYSGDATWEPRSMPLVWQVDRRPPDIYLDSPSVNPARVGQPVELRATVLSGLPDVPATGTVTLGSHGDPRFQCTATLVAGVGACEVTWNYAHTAHLVASYGGDTRFLPVRSAWSAFASLEIVRGRTSVAATVPVPTIDGQQAWVVGQAVPVSWAVTSEDDPDAILHGVVQVWSSQGSHSSCGSTAVGSCEVVLSDPAERGWIEVRFLGGPTLAPSTSARTFAPVLGCFAITVEAPGRAVTPPNCAGGRYVGGTSVDLDATIPAGHTLEGWNFGRDSIPYLVPSPITVLKGQVIWPYFSPICHTLSVRLLPSAVSRAIVDPAPNCDALVGPDGQVRDLAAIREREMAWGEMRYRVGTVVRLPYIRVPGPPGELLDHVWSGDATGTNTTASVTMDGDRDVVGRFAPSCRRFVVDAAPGVTTSLSLVGFDPGENVFLKTYWPRGTCNRPDGPGFLAGATVRAVVTAPTGMWFSHFDPLERLAGHVAPTGPVVVDDRPADLSTVKSTGTQDFTVPAYDAAVSGHVTGVVCHELKISLEDAVSPSQLVSGSGAPTVATDPAPNCPSWWLREQGIYQAPTFPGYPVPPPLRWYRGGTSVALTASTAARSAYVYEYPTGAPQRIAFREWTGDATATTATARVVLDAPRSVTARWYVPTTCARLIVGGLPAGSGEVVTSDVSGECPIFNTYGGPVPQERLGHFVTLVARPKGNLQAIWQVEGNSVSNSEACIERDAYLAEQYAAGKTTAYLMEVGYLPGWNALQVERKAEEMYAKGYTQANIVSDLKQMGFLDASGRLVPDRLRTNPCENVRRDTALPAGQRVISFPVDGHTTATAWFCKPVAPTVTVIDMDGTRRNVTGASLNAFAPLFTSTTGNCPAPGFFLDGTTAVLGATGTNVPGYVLDGWTLDGQAKPAGPLSIPITADGAAHAVTANLRVSCFELTVHAKYGKTTDPAPDCPYADPSRGLYAAGSKVMVSAGQSSNHVWQGWKGWSSETTFNPLLVTMDQDWTLTASFRDKRIDEQIMDTVIDPAINALGIGAKKLIGGVAYVTKVIGQELISGTILTGLAAIGTALQYGFGALGIQGAVLDGFVIGLQVPKGAFDASFAGFDCIEEWAWGASLPTLADLKSLATSAVTSTAKTEAAGVGPAEVLAEARIFAEQLAAGGDEAALATALVLTGNAPAAAVLALGRDIAANPDLWASRGETAAMTFLASVGYEDWANFTWESSAAEAWTTGGDAFFRCMAASGNSFLGPLA